MKSSILVINDSEFAIYLHIQFTMNDRLTKIAVLLQNSRLADPTKDFPIKLNLIHDWRQRGQLNSQNTKKIHFSGDFP